MNSRTELHAVARVEGEMSDINIGWEGQGGGGGGEGGEERGKGSGELGGRGG